MDFMVVDGDEDHAVIAEEVAGEEEAGVDHGEPAGVVVSILLTVFGEVVFVVFVSMAIFLPIAEVVALLRFLEAIAVDEVIAGVVGRVDVDHLDTSVVAFFEYL